MFKKLFTMAMVSIAVFHNNCICQEIDFSGKDFVYAMGESTISFHNVCLCSLNGTNGKIINNYSGDTTLFNITANNCDTFRLLTYGIPIGYQDSISYSVIAESEITTYIFSANFDTSGIGKELCLSSLIYPTKLAGNNFLNSIYQPSPWINQFFPVSIADCTSIFIRPNPSSLYGSLSNPYYKTLDENFTWSDGGSINLTGTLLSSDSATLPLPFVAFASRFGGENWPPSFGDRTPILVQQLPVNQWKRNYHAAPHLTRQGDLYRILAAYDSTHININGSFIIILNATQYFDTLLTSSSFFNADKPVSIHEISRDAIEDSVPKSGAFMYPLMSDSTMLTKALFITDLYGNSSGLITDNYLNLVCRTTHTSLVMLDGLNVGSSFQTYNNDSAWSFAQLTITNGQHLIECDSGVIAYQYGYGNFRAQGNVVAGNAMLQITGINENQNLADVIKIYPNPAKNKIKVMASDNILISDVEIINTLGISRSKKQNAYLKNIFQLDVSTLPRGVYFIKLRTNKGIAVKKMILQ